MIRVALFVVFPCVLLGCSEHPPQPQPASVLLITVDTLRPDHLSAYGYRPQQTPHIDSLARDGALFEQAVCDVPWTTGSMASVFTGQYASRHRVRLSTERLPDSYVTLAERLRDNGFTTGAIVGSFPLASIYNLNQGFQTYDEDFTMPMGPLPPGATQWLPVQKIPPRLSGSPEEMQEYFVKKVCNDAFRPDNEVTDRAVRWLTAHRGERFFLWVHYFGPHERLNILQTWEAQSPRVIADYDPDLAFTDAQIGRLLAAIDAMGLHQNLLVVLHADHGQSLGENSYVGHGDNLYAASTHIPLLMRWPARIQPGQRVQQLAQNVDLLPTILSLRGIHTDEAFSGMDLSPWLAGAQTPAAPGAPRTLYSETYLATIDPHQVTHPVYGPLQVRLSHHAIRHGDRMYILTEFHPPCHRADGSVLDPDECQRLSLEEFVDVAHDPQGAHNLIDAEAEQVGWYREQLAHERAAATAGAQHIELSPSQRERLRALGYEH